MARILVVGAHPDDGELLAGGTAALWCERGDTVRFLAMTDGSAGHPSLPRPELAARRRSEALRAAGTIGAGSEVLDHEDGALVASVEVRVELIRRIRDFGPDLILTHRPWDYHPDHRAAGTLVLDATYLCTVPLVAPESPRLEAIPVIAWLRDDFRRPVPFRADVAVDIDRVVERKWELLDAHASQFYEWLPYQEGRAGEVPEDSGERRRWLVEAWEPRLLEVADACRDVLVRIFGLERGRRVRHAEAFEIGEHGRRPAPEELRRLFPL